MSREIVIRESHILDGAINANVFLGDDNIGSVMVNLTQWDALRSTYHVKVMNLGEQSEQEDDPDE